MDTIIHGNIAKVRGARVRGNVVSNVTGGSKVPLLPSFGILIGSHTRIVILRVCDINGLKKKQMFGIVVVCCCFT